MVDELSQCWNISPHTIASQRAENIVDHFRIEHILICENSWSRKVAAMLSQTTHCIQRFRHQIPKNQVINDVNVKSLSFARLWHASRS